MKRHEYRRILVVHRSLADGIADRLGTLRPDLEIRARTPGRTTPADLAWAEVLVGFRRPPGGLGNARWVHCIGAGVDGWTDGVAWPPGVILTRTTESFAAPIGEYVTARVLAVSQQLPALIVDQQARRWRDFVPRRAQGSRAVVVGTGDLGHGIASRLGALGVTVTGVSRSGKPRADFARVVTVGSLAREITAADWLVLAAPLTSETRGLINDASLTAAQGAWLINVARAPLVDEPSMLRALDDGRLAGAALDVFATEPLPADSPLWTHPGVLISPHVAGVTSIEGAVDGLVASLSALEEGRDPPRLVDPEVGY